MVYSGNLAAAAYWMHWTVGHLTDPGANLDLILGRWGDNAEANDRVAISLVHRQQLDGSSALMVIDAADRSFANEGLSGRALARNDVIGTPLATHVFALTDAIYERDRRFF
jgi:hypothetical protein